MREVNKGKRSSVGVFFMRLFIMAVFYGLGFHVLFGGVD